MNAGNVNGHNSPHLDDNNNSNNDNNTGTQAPAGRVHAAVAADQADWALAAVPDGLNATGLLAEDLEDYAGGGKNRIELFLCADSNDKIRPTFCKSVLMDPHEKQ